MIWGMVMYSSTIAIFLFFIAVFTLLFSRSYFPKMKPHAELVAILMCMVAIMINMAAVDGYMKIISYIALGLLAIILLRTLRRIYRLSRC
jgi:hypothetical protein